MHWEMAPIRTFLIVLLTLKLLRNGECFVSSSEVRFCSKTSADFEPIISGSTCTKKMVVALDVRNGQGFSKPIYANIKFVDNQTQTILRKEQLEEPFRIIVTKSDVLVHYNLRIIGSVNNRPWESGYEVGNMIIFGIPPRHCKPNSARPCTEAGLEGFCCRATRDEVWGKAWQYKRGYGKKAGGFHSHKYSYAACMGNDDLWYNVFEVEEPFVTYKINVTVQQLRKPQYKGEEEKWVTIGFAQIGPEQQGANVQGSLQDGFSSGPQVIAKWHGDFAVNKQYQTFASKYLLVPDWRASKEPEKAKGHAQVKNGAKEWLFVDKHMVDMNGLTCNKIGASTTAFLTQENKCYQENDSCFRVTPKSIYDMAKNLEKLNAANHYFPGFYGSFVGTHSFDNEFRLVYNSKQNHISFVTLAFSASSISFVEHQTSGRFVEVYIEDFLALGGYGLLTAQVQNTGTLTADYTVVPAFCSEGIIRVSERTLTINPKRLETFAFEISTALNTDSNHSCIVQLKNSEGDVLDEKNVLFNTVQGCVYCPPDQCSCECFAEKEETGADEECGKKKAYVNPYWKPKVIVVPLCYHCWFTDSFKNPFTGAISVVILLLSVGMLKMLVLHLCCRTSDGRPIDIAGVILGTTNMRHTRIKQRSATIQFLLGACFFVYLPLFPLMILICTVRRRSLAKKRLKKKAKRRKERLMAKKKTALLAMKGLMVQEGLTMEDALKVMEEGQTTPGGPAPKLPPAMLVVSSSSGSDEQDFDYSTSDEQMISVSQMSMQTMRKKGGTKHLERRKGKGKKKKKSKVDEWRRMIEMHQREQFSEKRDKKKKKQRKHNTKHSKGGQSKGGKHHHKHKDRKEKHKFHKDRYSDVDEESGTEQSYSQSSHSGTEHSHSFSSSSSGSHQTSHSSTSQEEDSSGEYESSSASESQSEEDSSEDSASEEESGSDSESESSYSSSARR